jgi:hypothetical protein
MSYDAAVQAWEDALDRVNHAQRAIEQAEWNANMAALRRELEDAHAQLKEAHWQYDEWLISMGMEPRYSPRLKWRLPEGFTFMEGNPAPKGE